ncbi:MAG TPA: hypothetical protein VGD77_04030 [Gemmatimonadaceae bacterium]
MTQQSTIVARGANFVFARNFVHQHYGPEAWARVLARLSPEHRRLWESPLMLIGTYDFGAFKATAAAVGEETGAGDRALAAMYEYAADQSLNTLYKVFFRLANPAFVIGNFPKLWPRFFTAGEVRVENVSRDRAELRFSVPQIFLDWLGPACLGYSSKAVQLAGGTGVRVREIDRRAGGDGKWEVGYEVSWVLN